MHRHQAQAGQGSGGEEEGGGYSPPHSADLPGRHGTLVLHLTDWHASMADLCHLKI